MYKVGLPLANRLYYLYYIKTTKEIFLFLTNGQCAIKLLALSENPHKVNTRR